VNWIGRKKVGEPLSFEAWYRGRIEGGKASGGGRPPMERKPVGRGMSDGVKSYTESGGKTRGRTLHECRESVVTKGQYEGSILGFIPG